MAVQLRLDDSAKFVRLDRGGHESVGELLGKVRESFGFFRIHGGHHLSAADGGTTIPEQARSVQVRHDVGGRLRRASDPGHMFVDKGTGSRSTLRHGLAGRG